MINGYIRLKEVIEIMDRVDSDDKPVLFDIKFVTIDNKRDTGGQIIEVNKARKCIGKRNGKVVFDSRKPASADKVKKDPHHWENATRNILLQNGQIRKIHIRLIIEFNGKKVCY